MIPNNIGCAESYTFLLGQTHLVTGSVHYYLERKGVAGMTESNHRTGYPSIDKPWTKYYSEEEKNITIPKGSMFDLLYERNSQYPKDIALEYYGNKITYCELFHQIYQCCRNLSALGIKKGDIVTVQAIPLPQVIVLMYALNKLGACGNMLYPDAGAKEVIESMQKTDSHLLVAVDMILSKYEKELPASFNEQIILLNVTYEMSFIPKLILSRKTSYKKTNINLRTITWKEFISGEGTDYQDNHDNTIPAYMLRTGGTTGIPKEVVLDSKGFNSVAESIFYHGISDGYKRQDCTLLLLPPFIAFGVGTGIHHPLVYGARLVISLDVSPSAVASLVVKHKPRYLSAGVVQMEQLVNDLENKKLDLSFLKLLWVGGEAMNQGFEERLCSFLIDHGCSAIPLSGYGLTETTAGVTAETMKVHKKGSVGTPFALCSMMITDPDTGKELPYNTSGEVFLSSPGLMQGYYKNPQATDEVIEIIDGIRWLHTGDIGIISEDGMLTITGRIKRIITCREGNIYHKVFPLLIENRLAKIDGVQEISIVGRPDKTAGNVPVAFVVPTQAENFSHVEKALRDYCMANLETFERPAAYCFMDRLPRTLIGKVDYRALEKIANGES